MGRILDLYEKHPDKPMHFIVVLLLTIIGYATLGFWSAIGLATLFSFGKELFDYKFRTTGFSTTDLIADFAGMGTALFLIGLNNFPFGV